VSELAVVAGTVLVVVAVVALLRVLVQAITAHRLCRLVVTVWKLALAVQVRVSRLVLVGILFSLALLRLRLQVVAAGVVQILRE
tara:strand:- start:608 stop:859 length:252 start_codon:yes stop_codon:yes gene_type:complete